MCVCEFAPTDGKWYSAITWARSCLYQCVYNFYQNITHETRVWARFMFFRILTSAKPRPITWARACQYQCVCIFLFHNIPHRSRDRVSFFLNLDVGKASTNGKWHLTIPWTRYHQHQCVRVRICFSKYSLWFNSYGQFLLTDYRRTTSQTDYNRTHKLTTGR